MICCIDILGFVFRFFLLPLDEMILCELSYNDPNELSSILYMLE